MKLLQKIYRKYRFFTLLEVMVAIALLAIASSVVGLRMHKAIQKKKFQSALEQLKARITTSQKLAIGMQADWKGKLIRKNKGWLFEAVCQEIQDKKLPLLYLNEITISLNGKKIDALEIDFFSSGHTNLEGSLKFSQGSQKVEWKTVELFLRDEGNQLGPSHPEN